MARKGIFGNSLKNAMEGKFDDPEVESPLPRRSSPNMARAEASLKEEDRRATRLISPALIHPSRFSDRIDATEDLTELIESIREHGQQVPILLRRLDNGDLEVVYGRRRMLACKELGIDVRASVMEMTEEEALIAQGVENNQRLDTSFIEKALFIAKILDAGFKGVVVHRATGVNDTLIYKMKSIVSAIPESLIRTIGPAHGAGRRQWEALATFCRAAKPGDLQRIEQAAIEDPNITSPERLERAIAATVARSSTTPSRRELVPGRISAAGSGKRITLTATSTKDQPFLNYLSERIPELLETWERQMATKE
ncbi:plasmid partitioning protein RepB [Paenirhodobacter populi]|uniref:Plasmid partitioning protein RepB n=1 Tax=Paenirhodobacter populi TaxID=2306993 RepID=A0A443IQP1_9RHOB|nr:plasmid partitioning protein RepB [Sinirhodobacter populi]RWR09218.1 plasmid partitioning protein RepB [Sinirhodobacter populi]